MVLDRWSILISFCSRSGEALDEANGNFRWGRSSHHYVSLLGVAVDDDEKCLREAERSLQPEHYLPVLCWMNAGRGYHMRLKSKPEQAWASSALFNSDSYCSVAIVAKH